MPKGVYIRTEEHRRIYRESRLGEKNPMFGRTGDKNPFYGRHHKKETVEYLRIIRLGRYVGEKSPLFGKHPDKETIDKMSAAKEGKYLGKNNPNYGNGDKLKGDKNPMKRLEVKVKFIGDKNPAWNNGSSRKPYGFDFTPEKKNGIFERDNHTCQLCEATEKLVPHHIDYDKKNSRENNLITLCNGCNARVNFNREYWKYYFQNRLYLKVAV